MLACALRPMINSPSMAACALDFKRGAGGLEAPPQRGQARGHGGLRARGEHVEMLGVAFHGVARFGEDAVAGGGGKASAAV